MEIEGVPVGPMADVGGAAVRAPPCQGEDAVAECFHGGGVLAGVYGLDFTRVYDFSEFYGECIGFFEGD